MEIIYKDWRSALIWLSPSSFLKEVFEDGAFNLLSIDFPIGDICIYRNIHTYISLDFDLLRITKRNQLPFFFHFTEPHLLTMPKKFCVCFE